MEFVSQHENGRYYVNQEAAKILSQMGDTPIAIVGISGNYRKGKSTVLNKIMGVKVFSTNETTRAQTKGLWFAEMSPGIFLMDTEGFGSTQQENAEHDFNIFSLTVLLSSILIYNNDGPVTTEAVNSLKIAGKLADMMKKMSSIKLSDTLLFWLSRNLSLKPVDDAGKPCSGDTYLELRVSKNTEVNALFPKRQFFSLPIPALYSEDIANMTKLVPEFILGIQLLKQNIIQCIEPKKCNGIPLTGSTLLVMITSLVSNINSGEIISLVPVWEASVKNREMQARKKAEQYISEHLKEEIKAIEKAIDIYTNYTVEFNPSAIIDLCNFYQSLQEQAFLKWIQSDMSMIDISPSILRYIEPILDKQTSTLTQNLLFVKEELQQSSVKYTTMKKQYEQDLDNKNIQITQLTEEVEQCSNTADQNLRQLKSDSANKELLYANLDTTLKETILDLEEAKKELSKLVTSNFELNAQLKTAETTRDIASADVLHLRSNINERLNDLRTTMAKQKTMNENLQQNLTLTSNQLIESKNEHTELETKLAKESLDHLMMLTKLRKEKSELSKEIDSAKTTIYELETQIRILKSREDIISLKRQRPSESNDATITWLKNQHEKDIQDIKSMKEEHAICLRRIAELEVTADRLPPIKQ